MTSRFFLVIFSCTFLVVTSVKAMDPKALSNTKNVGDTELEFLRNNGAKVPLRHGLTKGSTMSNVQRGGTKTTVDEQHILYRFWQLPKELQINFNQANNDLKAHIRALKVDLEHYNEYYEEMKDLSKELNELSKLEKSLEPYLMKYKKLFSEQGNDVDYISLIAQGSKEALEESSKKIRIIRCRFFEECEMEKIKFVSKEKLIKHLERKREKSLLQLEELYNLHKLVEGRINGSKAFAIGQWKQLLSKIQNARS